MCSDCAKASRLEYDGIRECHNRLVFPRSGIPVIEGILTNFYLVSKSNP